LSDRDLGIVLFVGAVLAIAGVWWTGERVSQWAVASSLAEWEKPESEKDCVNLYLDREQNYVGHWDLQERRRLWRFEADCHRRFGPYVRRNFDVSWYENDSNVWTADIGELNAHGRALVHGWTVPPAVVPPLPTPYLCQNTGVGC
jgi:hypothetical protein